MGVELEHSLASHDADLETAVRAALLEVNDPEIPTLSVLDLGMVREVTCSDGCVEVKMTPTFMGCPALAIIRKNVETRLQQVEGVKAVSVDFVYDEPWTTDRISDIGKQKLKQFGIAPPSCSLLQMKNLTAECPYCGSTHTRLENLFGPTACRSVFYCEDCKQPFEAIKPV
ncbi:phenylacetate-CoA oxygenase subunit PaaJ [Alicyclobacillus cycloheptanicus]|uniref:Ring-1,2-phenylacetyl-CoA epoxidase subunit PaaD n=1 Tax=Alicyclobacillus cycloheptanicus TaxID=1457 RepID=A0ABT9XEI0_9BACL|nr:1,2-phenylacetyl-CoA epoxidase subunit PaaD [Alicyclobacillus cycloheptanicus]MDQ0188685.1 ring-1,2-phenylacetyl-CoA epoxidase subunit PaaD [Alicyclobacillus cycloheptanicus]WDM00643.1 phenylacetate-CoA oxygenase subunit PaaJ [Alicyclobacillus cycloheptanicus]